MLPRSPFRRVIREIAGYVFKAAASVFRLSKLPFFKIIFYVWNNLKFALFCFSTVRFTAEAMECLQVAAEAFIIKIFEDSELVMINAKRKTLMERDVKLIRQLRGI